MVGHSPAVFCLHIIIAKVLKTLSPLYLLFSFNFPLYLICWFIHVFYSKKSFFPSFFYFLIYLFICPSFCVFYIIFCICCISFSMLIICFSIFFTLCSLFTASMALLHSGHLNWNSAATSNGTLVQFFLQQK